MLRLWLIFSFCWAASICLAQTECPTNYDSDSDEIIGVSDLLFFLGLFGESDSDNDGIWSPFDDCDGIVDACGVCGGDGVDTDGDGVCDLADTCVGTYDECGVCGGDGPNVAIIDSIIYTYDSLFISNLNEWYVFVVESDTTFTFTCPESGCTSPSALNFNASAVFDDGTCLFVNPYVISEIEFTPPYDWSDGTSVINSGDDVHSDVLSIGFDFNFFGALYHEFRVSSNGWLSFDLNETAGYNPNGVIPNANLPANSVMAVYSDLTTSVCGNVRFGLDGEAPNRKCFVNWNAVCQFSCTSQTVNAQIVLHETTNSIDIYIGQRHPCSWGSMCTGIQNSAETQGAYPIDLPTGNWDVVDRAWHYATAFGQPQSTEECGYNPDSDSDSYLTVTDLLGLLGQFGNFLGECEDMDADGVCDDVDDCIGIVDECGVCNGPGPGYPVIDEVIFSTDSIFVEQLDEWYVYEYPTDTLYTYLCEGPGCTDPDAINWNPYATYDDSSCILPEGLNPCGELLNYYGYDYSTVQIGEQCWFAENLRSPWYRNGDLIYAGLDALGWESAVDGSTAVYGEAPPCSNYSPDGDACDAAWSVIEYGRLYNWLAVNDVRGLCPSGWRVPSDEDWIHLELHLGMSESDVYEFGDRGTDQGVQLRSTYGWAYLNGSDSVGFSGLPGGMRESNPVFLNGSFDHAGATGTWWTSTGDNSSAISRWLPDEQEGIFRGNMEPTFGFSVRCIKNTE